MPAFQHAEGFFKKLITIEDDGIDEESNEHVNIKFPTLKLLKPFNLFEKKKEKLERILEKEVDALDSLIEKKLEKWEAKRDKFNENLLDLIDFFKEAEHEIFENKAEIKDKKPPAPAPVYEPPYPYGPAPVPVYGPPPAPLYRESAPASAYGPPSAYSYHSPAPSLKYGHSSHSYSHYKPSRPAHPTTHRSYVERESSEERTYSYKPIRPVRPKPVPRPTSHYADCDYEVRYFT